jgi:exonuclease III
LTRAATPSTRSLDFERFPKNDGLRLDYLFATASLATRCTSAEIDRHERKGEKPSDHAPVIAVFDDGWNPPALPVFR